jgi:hypothetical protein
MAGVGLGGGGFDAAMEVGECVVDECDGHPPYDLCSTFVRHCLNRLMFNTFDLYEA